MIRSYILLVFSVVCFLAGSTRAWAQPAPCNNWNIQTQIDSATCESNGRIAITITGVDKENLTALLYSLNPLSGGGHKIEKSASAVLSNLPPGTYEVVVDAVCNGAPVSKSIQVRIPGVHKGLRMDTKPTLETYGTCAFGQMRFNMEEGSKPYVVSIVEAPAAYTGPRTFTSNDSMYDVNNLNGGYYKVAVEDACNTRIVDSGTVVQKDVRVSLSADVYAGQENCNYFIGTTLFVVNRPDIWSHFSYSLVLPNGEKLPFKQIDDSSRLIPLPPGTTLDDLKGKYVGVYLSSDCGDTIYGRAGLAMPEVRYTSKLNCDDTYGVECLIPNAKALCFPIIGALRNNTNGITYYDTIKAPESLYWVPGLFENVKVGEYTLTLTDRGGFVITSFVSLTAVDNNYTISLLDRPGAQGCDGAIGFSIVRTSGRWMKNTVVELISPKSPRFYYNMGQSPSERTLNIFETTDSRIQYFSTGSYVFRITDSCGKHDLPIIVTENDVYRYNWRYTTEQTCAGLKVTPVGTKTYGGQTDSQVLYRIFSGPANVWATIRQGESLILPIPGDYIIGIGSYDVDNFRVNVKTIRYVEPRLLQVDQQQTMGLVCPNAAPNTGTIRIAAMGGKSGTRHYVYKLAEQGSGANGPYLDSNSIGSFTSNARYSLMKNTNYSIKIIDDCETSIVQDVQILDFANYPIITADKPMFCVGDTVYLSAVNLPTQAQFFSWDFPNGQKKEGRSQMILNMDSSKAGKYKITINTDICQQPIKGELDIKVAPYTVRCYSAVTDTSVNPYIQGLLGNWRPFRSYVYYGARAEADPAVKTDIRKDGAYNDFMNFWEKQTASWTPRKDTTRWVWNAESTVFSRKGFELENKDPLGRYNAGLYGYDGAVPVAVVQNSRYRESGFDGFEDYSFVAGNCEEDPCPVGRHFNFSRYKNKLSTEQSHTGRYSLKAAKGDSIMLSALVTDSDRLLTVPDFQQAEKCNMTVLKAVRLNPGVLVPEFSPVAGKRFLFSVWVKEEQDCKCTTYSSSEITLLVGGPVRVTVTAQPKGAIIDGWQQYEGVIDVPKGSTAFNVVIVPKNNVNVYYDDLRIHPYNANMKSFVYDPVNLRLMAELDENNYATLYEYDDDGTLTRVKKETERGVKTIKETRSALLKETAQ